MVFGGSSGRYPVRKGLGWAACSLASMASLQAHSARAQSPDQTTTAEPVETPPDSQNPGEPDRQIVVIGDRTIIASLRDAEVEETYSADRAASYGASTVGEVLEQIRNENGDADPSILINGQPAGDAGEISDLPIEAVERIEALPRGSAARIGGSVNQRAYNVVLRSSVRSATFTGSRQIATEGRWGTWRGEALFTYVHDRDRLNLAFRYTESDPLFESDRAIVGFPEPVPFSRLGNILPVTGTEIDPAFSALVGHPVNLIAVPPDTSVPTLASLVPQADQRNPSLTGLYRSLRGSSRPVEVSLTGNKQLNSWLEFSLNGRMAWTAGDSYSGLPAARFLIPAGHPNNPFSRSVFIALNDPSRPLVNHGESTNGSIALTLNANFGDWRAVLGGKYDKRNFDYENQFGAPIPAGAILVDPLTNPFAGSLASLIPVATRLSQSRNRTGGITFDVDGPVLELPAGKLTVRAGLGAGWVGFDADDAFNGPRSIRRHETSYKAGVSIPITGGSPGFLPEIGTTELNFEAGRIDYGLLGEVFRYALALNWRAASWLRLSASETREERAPAPELLAAPSISSVNVPYFDSLTGQSVTVSTIYGGNANLKNEVQRVRLLSLVATPLARNNLQLNATYTVTDLSNQIGALPAPSSAVMLAFPDRFVRDGSGRLILVDGRTINFENQHTRQLRLGLAMNIPVRPAAAQSSAPRGPRMQPTIIQINAAHTFTLESKTTIRSGLGEVDLLQGGAIGIGGGQLRHSSDASLTVVRGGNGLRLSYVRRGGSLLAFGTPLAPSLLSFAPVNRLDLRVFVEAGTIFPHVAMARNTRLSVNFENFGNERQAASSSAGSLPLGFQPAYRDPIGRTITFELRKVF